MDTETTYLFWVSNTTKFAPETDLFTTSKINSNDVVIGVPANYLPTGKDDPRLVVLHREHANLSKAMVYEPKEGTFVCRHCLKKVSVSQDTFLKVLKEISAGHTGLLGTSEQNGMEIVLLTILYKLPEVDFAGNNPIAGYYLARIKPE